MHKEITYRPSVHFTPPENWTNDPNGMVYINGKYHLFYQHYPEAPHWGPMHWGHAVSEDLLHWEHLPIAIYPDELGMIFSGSCVLDKDNVSGFGTKENPPLIAIYTSHKDESHIEQQSIAYSLDYVHFEKYYGNPVITNGIKPDFRDPKVFWNPVYQCYSMVLAAGEKVEFYKSLDLKHWEKTGDFQAGEYGIDGICECPDCFPIMTEEGEKWVLIISMILPKDKVMEQGDVTNRMEHITQYYVGDFDGDKFIDTEKSTQPLILDYGTDNYAAVTFQNLKEKIMMGWACNWDYASDTPSIKEGFCGMMTLPRKIKLIKTTEGYRLSYSFEGMSEKKAKSFSIEEQETRLHSQSFGIQAFIKEEGIIEISNSINEVLRIQISEQEIIIDRNHAGQNNFNKLYERDSYGMNRAPRNNRKECKLDIVYDKSILEVIADDGLKVFSINVFPTKPYELLTLQGNWTASMYELP